MMIYLLTITAGFYNGVYFYHVMDKKYYYYTTHNNYRSCVINFLYVFEHDNYHVDVVEKFDKKFDDIWTPIKTHNYYDIDLLTDLKDVHAIVSNKLENTLLDIICDGI